MLIMFRQTFKHTLFFNLILPPIILNSGYELRQDNFFRNFFSILTFAFLGTFISAVGLGVLVYLWSFLGLESLQLSLLECLIFGSTLSATDPVTILAIFNQYKVDPKLYSVIFGESILNDAVSIVMYDTLSQFHGEDIYLSSLFHGIGLFLLSFSTSMALGVAFGLMVSLTLKHSHLSFYPSLESCLVALTAYTSYFFSNALQMSGIVSLLFCGITLKHYAYHTMSLRTQRTTRYIFSMLAQLSENFIFIYLGLSIFTIPPHEDRLTTYIKPLFIMVTLVSVVFTRYASVFPLAELINLFHRHVRGQRHDELPHSYQMMLFWAGLRGAVGVALAAGFQGPNAQTLRSTVLVVVVATVILFGGTTARMLEMLGVRTGVEDVEGGDESDPDDYYYIAESAFFGRPSRNSTHSRPYHQRDWDNYPYGRYTDNEADHDARVANLPSSHPSRQGNRNERIFSASFSRSNSSSSADSDIAEVLPMPSPVERRASRNSTRSSSPSPPQNGEHQYPGNGMASDANAVSSDSKWFQAIDERYLLPLFSNATASRTFHARRVASGNLARRRNGSGPNASVPALGGYDEYGHEQADDLDGGEVLPLGDVHHGPTQSTPIGNLRSLVDTNRRADNRTGHSNSGHWSVTDIWGMGRYHGQQQPSDDRTGFPEPASTQPQRQDSSHIRSHNLNEPPQGIQRRTTSPISPSNPLANANNIPGSNSGTG